jgi:hypothetical protein
VNERVYVHEFIDIIGQNRAKYIQHMTANWCPIAREERDQLCFGVWGTVGSTGRWPEVVNLWELPNWDALGRSFDMERSTPKLQDKSLISWWADAAPLRRGGVDRVLVGAPWTRGIDELVADGVRGDFYAHDVVTLPPGTAATFLDHLRDIGKEMIEAHGLTLCGAWRTAMKDDHECIVIWAVPDWKTWVDFEQAWLMPGPLDPWRKELIALDARIDRILLMDSPLNPMKTGRQPQVEDRRPLSEI